MTNSWWLRASWDRPARSHETWLLASYQLVVRVEKGRQLQGSAAEIAALLGKSDVGQRVVRASGGGGFCYNYRSSSNCYRLKSLCSSVTSLKTGSKLAKNSQCKERQLRSWLPGACQWQNVLTRVGGTQPRPRVASRTAITKQSAGSSINTDFLPRSCPTCQHQPFLTH